jgi:lycopene beta-cyclase
MLPDIRCDVAIVGGGLAGGLIAYALAARRPDLDVRIVESGERLRRQSYLVFFLQRYRACRPLAD